MEIKGQTQGNDASLALFLHFNKSASIQRPHSNTVDNKHRGTPELMSADIRALLSNLISIKSIKSEQRRLFSVSKTGQ